MSSPPFLHFLHLLVLQGLGETKQGKWADANAAVVGAGKAQLSKRVTHFSCEMKVNSSPVFLGPFSGLPVAMATGTAPGV